MSFLLLPWEDNGALSQIFPPNCVYLLGLEVFQANIHVAPVLPSSPGAPIARYLLLLESEIELPGK